MKKLINHIFSIISQKLYIQIILIMSIVISIYSFCCLSLPLLTEENKNLRKLEINSSQTNNDSDIIFNSSDLINNNTFINDSIINNDNKTNETNNDEFNIIIKVRPLKINITEKIIYYEFIKTITTGFYYGNWNNLNIKKNKFHDKKGEGYINIYRKSEKNYLLNLGEVHNSSKINNKRWRIY